MFIILVASKRQTNRFKSSLQVFFFRNRVNRSRPKIPTPFRHCFTQWNMASTKMGTRQGKFCRVFKQCLSALKFSLLSGNRCKLHTLRRLRTILRRYHDLLWSYLVLFHRYPFCHQMYYFTLVDCVNSFLAVSWIQKDRQNLQSSICLGLKCPFFLQTP